MNDLQLIISDTNVTSNYNPLITEYINIIFNNIIYYLIFKYNILHLIQLK